jgi:hypothetical protein
VVVRFEALNRADIAVRLQAPTRFLLRGADDPTASIGGNKTPRQTVSGALLLITALLHR